jgi:hypothetical protein
MKTFYPKNFDPAIYLGCDGMEPEQGNDETWSIWCLGGEPRFPEEFALFCWWHLTDALDTFVSWDKNRQWPKEYRSGGDLAQKRFRKELALYFRAVGDAVGAAWQTQPFKLESPVLDKLEDDQLSYETLIKAHCVYCVKSMDDGISGLFENDQIKATLGFSYSIRALELAHEYRDFDSHALLERMDRSRTGKVGALKRHAPMTALNKWAIETYRKKKWPSANAAAHDIKDDVIAYGKTIGAHLSKENAQRTIAEWIRKANRSV